MMLRVLTLATLFPDRSRPRLGPFVERQTRELAKHPEVELQIVAPRGLPPWPLSLHPHYRDLAAQPEREDWQGVTVHRPRFTHWPGTQGRFDANAMARALTPLLVEIRRGFAFDVIDAEFFFPDGSAAIALGQAFGVPVSIKARGGDIHRWGTAPATAPQIVAAGRAADGLLAVSGALRDDMVALGMPADRIAVHHTGVDLAAFVPRERAAGKARLGLAGPVIASVATLTPRKGQGLLVDALPLLPCATLVLIGTGPARAHLEAQAAALGVADRLRFTGSIGHDEIASWLAAADVMALPSASEGLANAWVEALACGTPVAITDVGGAREVVTGPDAGRLIAPDARAIAGAVAELLENPPEQAAVRAFAERFTWGRNRDALYAHLSRLVANFGN